MMWAGHEYHRQLVCVAPKPVSNLGSHQSASLHKYYLYSTHLCRLGLPIRHITRSNPAVLIIIFLYIIPRLLFAIAASISMPRPLMELLFGSILDDATLEGPKCMTLVNTGQAFESFVRTKQDHRRYPPRGITILREYVQYLQEAVGCSRQTVR
jgi:hypothetical protein